jgi:hypothetical protein
MIDDYDSSEGRWPGLGAFLVVGGPGLGRRRETGIRGRVFGLRLEGLEKLCIQGIEGWLNVE